VPVEPSLEIVAGVQSAVNQGALNVPEARQKS